MSRVRLLLTSTGVKNPSIRDALVDLLGKPIADSNALCIPTAQYGHPWCGPASAWRFITGRMPLPMCDLGWKSLGVLELTALASIGEERWVPWVKEADVLLVAGGDAAYLCHWMRQSGLADRLPSLDDHRGRRREVGGRDRRSGVRDRDQTAIKVTGGTVEVVSEGEWKLFPR